MSFVRIMQTGRNHFEKRTDIDHKNIKLDQLAKNRLKPQWGGILCISEQLGSLVRHIRDSGGENMIVGLTKKEAREQDTTFHESPSRWSMTPNGQLLKLQLSKILNATVTFSGRRPGIEIRFIQIPRSISRVQGCIVLDQVTLILSVMIQIISVSFSQIGPGIRVYPTMYQNNLSFDRSCSDRVSQY
jgi:hypothetical protein